MVADVPEQARTELGIKGGVQVRDVREATVDEVGSGSAGTGFFRVQAPGGTRLH